MKVITVILDQRGRPGLMDVSRNQWRFPTKNLLRVIGSGVPGVAPVALAGPSSLASRQRSVDGDWLVGRRGPLGQAAALP